MARSVFFLCPWELLNLLATLAYRPSKHANFSLCDLVLIVVGILEDQKAQQIGSRGLEAKFTATECGGTRYLLDIASNRTFKMLLILLTLGSELGLPTLR